MEKKCGYIWKLTLSLLLAVSLLSLSTQSIWGETSKGKRNVTNCVSERTALWKKKTGDRLLSTDVDLFEEAGDIMSYKLTLQQGLSYQFMICGEKTLQKLKLEVFNFSGQLVGSSKQGNKPMLSLKPEVSDVFIVKVISGKGRGYYSFAMMAK